MMFLKRLSMIGFKSFAERTTIDFEDGITAIVGPNGSGKSNITEAIRWVLGEQSAKSLRGSKMEDVIFSGSERRKPINVAEVTLTLDNESGALPLDYLEISITRRAYRSGESEYLINNQICRLKDIVELFMDTGLGRDASSMISQGKVEQVLSSKAEDRRKVIEEAAGVLKYKARKQQAETKLTKTEENVQRIEDILHELEGQLESLKIQASKARDYLEQKDALKTIEVALLAYEIETLYERWKEQGEKLKKINQKELEMATAVQKLEANMIAQRQEIESIDQAIEDKQSTLLTASEELEKVTGEADVLNERKKNIAYQKDELYREINRIREQIEVLEKQKNRAKEKEAKKKKTLLALEEQLTRREKSVSNDDVQLSNRLEDLKTEYIDLLNEQAALKNQLHHQRERKKQQHGRIERLEQEIDEYIERKREKTNIKKQLEKKREQLCRLLQTEKTNGEQVKEQYIQAEQEHHRIDEELQQVTQTLQQIRSRKEILEELQEDYSGFFQGVKEILKARHRLKGVHGAVAELITVPKHLEMAIEIALGSALQHIVVDCEQHAREAIQYLKKNQLGRATLLPLTNMKGRFLADRDIQKIAQHPKFIGIAHRLIACEQQYDNVFSYLLGRIVIARDLQAATEIAGKTGYRVRIVTLDGDVVNPGGSITGGAVSKQRAPLLARRRELDALTKQLMQTEHQKAMLQQKKQQWELNKQNYEAKHEHHENECARIRSHIQTLQAEMKEIAFEIEHTAARLNDVEQEKILYLTEVEQIQADIVQTEKSFQDIQRQVYALDHEINKVTDAIIQRQLSKEAVQEEVTTLRIQVAEYRQAVSHHHEHVVRINDELRSKRQALAEREQAYEKLCQEFVSITEQEKKANDLIAKKQEAKESVIHWLAENRKKRLQLYEKMKDEEQALKAEKRLYKQVNETQKREELALERYDVELENRLDKLREEYEMTFERAKKKYPLTIDVEKAKEKIKLLKMTMNELGTVNLGAIEEFERVEDRYNFLTEQRNDLLTAKETLNKVISEMDDEMKRRFQTTFNHVRQRFQETFKDLFGGGRADLTLTDPDNLLETGIDIFAEPPGKKLQHHNLLSGGERALTAIGLLFAILKVRPIPFCVLDEVEASLDETNAARFAAYLQKISDKTQFIVVTHRKMTMEKADALYGVTMLQKSGISKMVSVKLEQSMAVAEETVS